MVQIMTQKDTVLRPTPYVGAVEQARNLSIGQIKVECPVLIKRSV